MQCPSCDGPLSLIKTVLISPLSHGVCPHCQTKLTKPMSAVLMTALPPVVAVIVIRPLLVSLDKPIALALSFGAAVMFLLIAEVLLGRLDAVEQ